ncbi:MAG: hypothetical protein WB760_08690 [Xanthobacteraceae bacterium]
MADDDKQNGSRRPNLMAMAALAFLFVIGWLLVRQLYTTEQLEDCILSGQTLEQCHDLP